MTLLSLRKHNIDQNSQNAMPLLVFTKPIRKKNGIRNVEACKLFNKDLAKFCPDVAQKHESMLHKSDSDTLTISFHAVLTEELDAYTTKFKKQVTSRTKYPWFNNEVKEQRQRIHKPDHLWCKYRLISIWKTYKKKGTSITECYNKQKCLSCQVKFKTVHVIQESCMRSSIISLKITLKTLYQKEVMLILVKCLCITS